MSQQGVIRRATKAVRRGRSINALVLCLVGIGAGQVQSQAIEEIIVTAERREQTIHEVPIAINAFTGRQLREYGIADTRDLGKIVAGFEYADSSANVPIFTLRGVGFDDNSQMSSSTVGLYLDEFNLPFPVMAKGPTVDVQRVEVMKGPQGTLFGRNTTAGAINYVTNKPSERFEAGIVASYGRFSTYDIEGYASGMLAEDLGLRFALRRIRATEGWQKSLTRPDADGADGELGRMDKWSGRFTLQWQPLDRLELLLAVDAWQDQSEPQAQQPIAIDPTSAQFPPAESVENHPVVPSNTGDMRRAAWPSRGKGFTWRLDDSFVMGRLRAGWLFSDDLALSYLSSYAVFRSEESAIPASGLSVLNVEGIHDVDTWAWTQELRLDGSWGADIDYNAGVFFSRDDVDQYFDMALETVSGLAPVNNRATFSDRLASPVRQKSSSQAVFVDGRWQFLPSWRLTAGARYTRESRDFAGCVADNPESTTLLQSRDLLNAISLLEGGSGDAGPGDCITLHEETRDPSVIEKSQDEDSLSGRLVLDWMPRDRMLFYLSLVRGFKSGSFPMAQATDGAQYNPASQERLDSLEFGGKLSLLENRLQFNFAAFYYDYRDKQLFSHVNDPLFGPLAIITNAPKSRVQGAEIELQASPLAHLDLLFNVVYLDSEIREFMGINQDGEEEDFSGNPFNYTAKWSGNLAARYRRPFPWLEGVDFHLGADYSYKDETNSVLSRDPRYHHRAYHNVNYQLGLADRNDRWKVTFWGRNVTNEYQVISIPSGAKDSIARFVRMPQTYGLTVEYHQR